MLTELVYCDRIYICGSVSEVRQRLLEHAGKYSTVKELLDDITPK